MSSSSSLERSEVAGRHERCTGQSRDDVDAWKARLHVLKPEELLVVCNSAFISGTALHPTSCTLHAACCTLQAIGQGPVGIFPVHWLMHAFFF